MTTIGLCWLLHRLGELGFGARCWPDDTERTPPFDVKDPYYDTPHGVQAGARVKHRVILVRHGESEHNKKYDKRGAVGMPLKGTPNLDTCLTDAGLAQSREVGDFLSKKQWHPDIIRVSPMLRTRETSSPYIHHLFHESELDKFSREVAMSGSGGACVKLRTKGGDDTVVVEDPQCMEVNTWCDQELAIGDCITLKHTYKGFVGRVKQWKKTLENDAHDAGDGKRIQSLVFTHSMVISEFLNLLVSGNREDDVDDVYDSKEWSKVYWQVNHGSITCADYMDNGEWHIHTVNYMDHLNTRTGLKAPFV